MTAQIDSALATWYVNLPQIAREQLLMDVGRLLRSSKPSPDHWQDWTVTLFPHLFTQPFATRHADFWQHLEGIEPSRKPPAYFGIWPRGGGKTTNAEAGAVYLGEKNKRKFCLYVKGIQDKANESVQSIAAMLESKTIARYNPGLAERKLGKYGNSKGWRVDTLRCANGFNVVALGFDAAVRGIKIEEYRPDLIILDDIDDIKDTAETTAKKVEILTKSILPAGSNDVAIIGIQNLVKWRGIFHQISEGKADFLLDRIVSGPYPAVEDLRYDIIDGKYKITGGTATWEGQNLEVCQDQMNEWGLSAFLSEAQQLIILKTGRVYHGFTRPGPASYDLDLSQAEGFYHSHDFGAVNHVWGLWVKIGPAYYLIHEEKLPDMTTADRAKRIGTHLKDRKVIAGWGGARGEKQQRLDFAKEGLTIRLPAVTDVESQIDTANRMLEAGELVICSDMTGTIDHLENCVRDTKEGIQDKSIWHFCDMTRYFCAGIKRQGWVR